MPGKRGTESQIAPGLTYTHIQETEVEMCGGYQGLSCGWIEKMFSQGKQHFYRPERCKAITGEAKAGEWGVQGLLQLQSELQISLGYNETLS